MEKKIIECDRCGKSGAQEYYAHVDRVSDAAGGMENVHERVDLCPKCTCLALRELLGRLDYRQAREWAKFWKERKPVNRG
jgi:ssDNA-binding Zn-finger/Zn-ribbon topoisomerase 1